MAMTLREYCMQYKENQNSIWQLCLSVRAINVLRQMGVHNVHALLARSSSELAAFPGMGHKTLREILWARDIWFRGIHWKTNRLAWEESRREWGVSEKTAGYRFKDSYILNKSI